MNFNQSPGIYDANTDELIMDYQTALKENVLFGKNNYYDTIMTLNQNEIKKPFYVILSNDVFTIELFENQQYLVGVSGKNVEQINDGGFFNCRNLEELDFPKLKTIKPNALKHCDKLEEKYTNKDGLYIINNEILISAKNYKEEKLIIPNNIKIIVQNAFVLNDKIKELVLPLNIENVSLFCVMTLKKIVLPINFSRFKFYMNHPKDIEIIYKGSEEQLRKTTESTNFDISTIKVEPYTIEELSKTNYSIKEMEYILDKKLTLDDILSLNHSMKDANEYFKQKEVEKDEL